MPFRKPKDEQTTITISSRWVSKNDYLILNERFRNKDYSYPQTRALCILSQKPMRLLGNINAEPAITSMEFEKQFTSFSKSTKKILECIFYYLATLYLLTFICILNTHSKYCSLHTKQGCWNLCKSGGARPKVRGQKI